MHRERHALLGEQPAERFPVFEAALITSDRVSGVAGVGKPEAELSAGLLGRLCCHDVEHGGAKADDSGDVDGAQPGA